MAGDALEDGEVALAAEFLDHERPGNFSAVVIVGADERRDFPAGGRQRLGVDAGVDD